MCKKFPINIKMDVVFDKVVSLGNWCVVAKWLQKCGLKAESYPLDWVVADLRNVLHCLSDDWADFLDRSLVCDKCNSHMPGLVYHHLKSSTFTDQEHGYYVRCVERFRKLAHQSVLFVYVSTMDEQDMATQVAGRLGTTSHLLYIHQVKTEQAETQVVSTTTVGNLTTMVVRIHNQHYEWDQPELSNFWTTLLQSINVRTALESKDEYRFVMDVH